MNTTLTERAQKPPKHTAAVLAYEASDFLELKVICETARLNSALVYVPGQGHFRITITPVDM